MTTLGMKIGGARKAKGLTQEALAEMLRLNLRTVQRIENSETMPRGSTLNLIGEALGLKPAELQIQDVMQKSHGLSCWLVTFFLFRLILC